MMDNKSGWMVTEVASSMIAGPAGSADIPSGQALAPDELLMGALQAHIDGERDSLASYRALAESTRDQVIQLIMGIVLDDERRHHELMRRIATQVKDDLYWAHSGDTLPSTAESGVDTTAHETLRQFVAAEQTAAQELRSLASSTSGLHGDLLFELLTMMALDSEKHEHLLRFLFRRVGAKVADEASRPEESRE
jgi:rubrerythrin